MQADTNQSKTTARRWQKTPYANLIRYVPSGAYFAPIRVRGKLIRRSLKTDVLSIAKLRLADLEKAERQGASEAKAVENGRMAVADAMRIHLERVDGDQSIKPRTKEYHHATHR